MTRPDYRTLENFGMSYYVVEPKQTLRVEPQASFILEAVDSGKLYGIGQPVPVGWYIAHMRFDGEKTNET